jgi:hypothetical protein
MNKYLLNTIGVAVLALVATTTWAVWEWGGVGQTTKSAPSALAKSALVQKMDKILDRIGEPKNGTIAEVDKLVLGSKSLVVHADLVARHEQQQLTTWDAHGETLFNNVNGVVSDVRGTVKQSTLTLAEAQTAIQAVETIPPHINTLADQVTTSLIPMPSALRGLTNVSAEIATFIHGPLTFATNNAGKLEDTANTSLGHVDRRWLAPWDGTHPFRHYMGATLGTGLQLGNLGATIIRDTK